MSKALLMLLMPALPLAASAADREVSPQAQQLADRVAVTGDPAGAPFIIFEKILASVIVFEPDARLRRAGRADEQTKLSAAPWKPNYTA